jgi:hypothetical protein
MASWLRREPPRIEPPLWYRTYDPEAWDEPDEQKRRMLAGCTEALGPEWVACRHRMHAERRWQEAKHRYRQAYPAFATQEFDDLVGEEARARRAARHMAGS